MAIINYCHCKYYEAYYKHVKYKEKRGYLAVFQTDSIKTDECISFLRQYLNTGERNTPDFIVNIDAKASCDVKTKLLKFVKKLIRTNVSSENVYEILNSLKNNHDPQIQAIILLILKAFDIYKVDLPLSSGSTVQARLIKALEKSGVPNCIAIADKILDQYVKDFFNVSCELFKMYECTVEDLITYKLSPIEVGYELVVFEYENRLETYGYRIPPVRIKLLKSKINSTDF